MPQFSILNIEPDNYSAEARAILAAHACVEEQSVDHDMLMEKIGGVDILITRLAHRIDADVLCSGERLKAIASATTGLDHIDTRTAQSRGIEVISLKGETGFLDSIPSTAEHTWGLILSLARNIPWAHNAATDGLWNRDKERGRNLAGQTLGLVGMGRVSRQVARMAQGFDMDVIAFDPYVTEFPDGVRRADGLKQLLESSFVVSLHIPLSEETEGLISTEELRVMGDDAYFINTSRGAIVDEDALLNALSCGNIAGAAIDVLSDEHSIGANGSHPVLEYAGKNRNLIVTPHIGGATVDSMTATEVFIANKIARFIDKYEAQGPDGDER